MCKYSVPLPWLVSDAQTEGKVPVMPKSWWRRNSRKNIIILPSWHLPS